MNLPETVLGVAFVMLALVGCRQATGGALFTPESCVRQVQQIDHVERVLVGFQVNSSIPLFDRK
jgi:hypothetical protein